MTLFRAVEAPPAVALFALDTAPTAGPAELAEIARLAEDLGCESLWVGEHPALPDPRGTSGPFPPTPEPVDPIVHLSCPAGVASRIKPGTGVVILPLRDPVVPAERPVSLDVLRWPADVRVRRRLHRAHVPRGRRAVPARARASAASTRSVWSAWCCSRPTASTWPARPTARTRTRPGSSAPRRSRIGDSHRV
ncbi:LLM class flavin-dependent oxidoreductase [Saccharothrix deserti]|uniref:LLM class flavin-dependent oxidoreductase n=1 Tax=Saccharothrix deserti TaxID=2593674 RepID=UPI00131B8D22|nr:LLM class flavin-dependent oxidoreductase [Saccharothrix deserti]